MKDKFSNLLRSDAWQNMPPRLYIALVSQLFRAPPTINLGEAMLVALIGWLAAWRAGDLVLTLLTTGTAGAVLLLIPATRRYRGQIAQAIDADEVRQLERRFELHSWVISIGIGLMALRGILATNDVLVHLMLVAIALGATSSNIRFHYRPRLTFGKTAAITGPLVLASILSGNTYYLALGLGALLASKIFLDICMELYNASITFLETASSKDALAQELEKKNQDFKQREVQRRVTEVALQRAQAELIHVSRLSAMGAMASTLAHELNQPLTATSNYIRGCRRLLAKSRADDLAPAVEAMAAAEAAAERAAQIVRRLRRLVFRGHIETKPERLRDLVDASFEQALADTSLMPVHRQVEIEADAEWVDVDAVQIQQVLINLIRNAAESMAESAWRQIIVSARPDTQSLVEVSVMDTGPGVPDNVREALFASFHTTKAEGMGMGLSICRTIIEAHGGRIWAEQGELGGATFCMTLPRPSVEEESDVKPVDPLAAEVRSGRRPPRSSRTGPA